MRLNGERMAMSRRGDPKREVVSRLKRATLTHLGRRRLTRLSQLFATVAMMGILLVPGFAESQVIEPDIHSHIVTRETPPILFVRDGRLYLCRARKNTVEILDA